MGLFISWIRRSIAFTLLIGFSSHATSLSFAIIGDAGEWNQASHRVQQSIQKGSVKNLILPGDNLYDTSRSYHDVWGHWSKLGFRFSVVAIGNHTKGYREEVQYFKMPGEAYSRSDGTVRFIVLNSDNEANVSQQAKFLDRELANAVESYVFVVYHHPSYTVGGHGWQEKREFHLQIRPLLQKHQRRITGLIVGHDHIASLVELNQIPMIVSGAVFEALPAAPVNYTEAGVKVKTRWLFQGGFYWTRLDINSVSKEVWVNFVSASLNQVTCSVRISPKPLLARDNCKKKIHARQ